ncbi:MAG: sulfurtransferase [Chromatiales bacterium 21-64-14]|nr:MAG: sulfurtransferase [Chromatiales bacterium 21-64-14]
MKADRLLHALAWIALAAGIAAAIAYRGRFDATALEAWIRAAGVGAPVLFMAVYALGTVLFLPGSVLTLAGGALFGPVLGTLYNLAGATLGATLAFLVARSLGAAWVERKAGARLQRLQRGVAAEGWRFVAFVRLVPLFPFNLLNYALGLTRIRLTTYVLASYLFMLPGALAYTYLGYAGREAVTGGAGMIRKGLLALSLLALVAFLPRLIGRLRKRPMLPVEELWRRLAAGDEVLVLDVRTGADYSGEAGHIPGARNLPLEELPQRIAELGEFVETTIAVVCRTDKRSAKAAQLLAGQGFADVHVVDGGMTAWADADLDVVRGTARAGSN